MMLGGHNTETDSMHTSGLNSTYSRFGTGYLSNVYGDKITAPSGYRSTIYGNSSLKTQLQDPAEIYVDKILSKGKCGHQKRMKGFGETMRHRRDQRLLTKQPGERRVEAAIKTRLIEVRKQTKQMNNDLHSIENRMYKVPKVIPVKKEIQEIDRLLMRRSSEIEDDDSKEWRREGPEEMGSKTFDLKAKNTDWENFGQH